MHHRILDDDRTTIVLHLDGTSRKLYHLRKISHDIRQVINAGQQREQTQAARFSEKHQPKGTCSNNITSTAKKNYFGK